MPLLNLNYRVYRLLTLLYALLIIGLSSIPSRSFPDLPIWTIDKVIHFTEYFIFGFLLSMGFPGKKWKFIALLILSGIAFSAFDEFYQSFIPGRNMDIRDWIADSVGFITGVGLSLLLRSRNAEAHIN